MPSLPGLAWPLGGEVLLSLSLRSAFPCFGDDKLNDTGFFFPGTIGQDPSISQVQPLPCCGLSVFSPSLV